MIMARPPYRAPAKKAAAKKKSLVGRRSAAKTATRSPAKRGETKKSSRDT